MRGTAPANIVVGRILASALAIGVLVFWVVGWVLTGGGAAGIAPEALPPSVALLVWAAVAVPSFGAALVFRGRALRVAERPAGGGDDAAERAAYVQTNLVIAWSLLESAALLAGVFFLLLGTREILLAAVPVYLIGFAVTFPRADWYAGGGGARELAGL